VETRDGHRYEEVVVEEEVVVKWNTLFPTCSHDGHGAALTHIVPTMITNIYTNKFFIGEEREGEGE